MTIRLTRTSHGAPTQSQGLEIDDDGHAAGWQTSGHRVGRFARDLSARERTALDRALTSAQEFVSQAVDSADPAGRVLRPSGATDQLTADGLPDVVLDSHGAPPPGLRKLVRLVRALLEEITESPLAAIELDVDSAPLRARLHHVGSEPVTIRMSTLTLRATLFDKDSAIIDSATHTVDASVDGPVGSGWTLPITDDLGLAAPRKGGFLTVTVGTPAIDALGDGVLRTAEFSWMTS